MDHLSFIADVIGIVSFLIGIGTFVNTLRIRKKILLRVEKMDFFQEIDGQVNNLFSYYETITTDGMYNEKLLAKIDASLDDLQISYESILPKKISTRIKELRTYIKQNCLVNLNDQAVKRECSQKLHSIALQLKKEKKVL